MTLLPNFERRLWYIIDELPILSRLRDLDMLLAESRKLRRLRRSGLAKSCPVGSHLKESCRSNVDRQLCTKIVFAEQNPLHAGRLAEMFGGKKLESIKKGCLMEPMTFEMG
ncbi:hypothetical protein DB44_CU00070 [Candidatus Protochlamydia amoebophila]|uniref:Type IV secretion system coupling protein TraD DNA-binding domain-containing protein n=1 Tax=Candidatus Protochlamydia amoebophila TaxID=362787 RepID=A0A0C1JL10_9BACT|nr:hypothetical protein DB44_CU00070 [Candidatus Protochlamydia amoebophila]